jgi:hypothetical protein
MTLSQTGRERCLARVQARLARLRADELVYRPEVLYAVAGRPAG